MPSCNGYALSLRDISFHAAPNGTGSYDVVFPGTTDLKAGCPSSHETGRFLPRHVTREFEDYLACGRLENGFLRVRCESCSHEHLVVFSCKRRGFCTSCGARRMVGTAALLVDHVLPHRPVRQWVMSFPYPLRFVLANHPQVMGKVLGIVHNTSTSAA